MNKEKPYSPSSDPAALTGRRRRCRGPGRRWPRLRSRVAAAGRALAARPGRGPPGLGHPRERERERFWGKTCVREREKERDFGGEKLV